MLGEWYSFYGEKCDLEEHEDVMKEWRYFCDFLAQFSVSGWFINEGL